MSFPTACSISALMLVPAKSEEGFWAKHLPPQTRNDSPISECSTGSNGRILPTELLQEIYFQYISVDEDEEDDDDDVPDSLNENISKTHRRMIYLAQVCRHWRTIPLSFTALWSSIYVPQPRANLVPLIELWIIRSGSSSLLDLELRVRKSDMDFEREIMDLFISQVHRWRDVEFRFTGTIPYEPLCDLPKGAAPSLERLSLSMRRWPRELQYRAWEALTYGVPQLRDMNIFMTSGIHSIPTIPWDQLTYISMPVRMRCSSLFKILPKCSNVERIFIMPTGANPTSHSPILLPCLKSLHMDTGMEPGLLPMFRYLTAPLLEDFMINIPERIPTTHVGLLNGFLSRSDSKLQTLSFDSKETPIDVLMPFFTSPYLANLQDIWLGVHADENLIRALTPSDASEPAMWPLLTRIYIGPCDLGIDGLIASLLRSRADKIVRAVIRVLNKEHGYVKDREMVEKLQQSGISVSLEVEMEDNTSE